VVSSKRVVDWLGSQTMTFNLSLPSATLRVALKKNHSPPIAGEGGDE